MLPTTPLHLGLAALLLTATTPALARPGGWGDRGGREWGGGAWNDRGWGREGELLRGAPRGPSGPPEGQVTVATFVSENQAAAAGLRTGSITVGPAPTGSGVGGSELAVYAAAVVDQLAQVGYRTDVPDGSAGQVTELHIAHATLLPQEVKKPVSGEMAVGVSNRGTAYGMALNIDLSKPKSALISTTLEARIRDKVSGEVLWEGRADIATREGDDKWSPALVATKLAAALFDRFPTRSDPPT